MKNALRDISSEILTGFLSQEENLDSPKIHSIVGRTRFKIAAHSIAPDVPLALAHTRTHGYTLRTVSRRRR